MENFDFWRFEIFYGLLLAILVVLARLYWFNRGYRLALLLWMYVLVSSLWGIAWPGLQPFQNILQIRLHQSMGLAFIQALVLPVFVFSLPEKWFKHWRKIFLLFGVVEVLFLWLNGWGLFLAPSFDSAYLAAILPIIPLWFGVIAFITILKTRGITAFLVIGAQVLIGLWRRKRAYAIEAFLLVAGLGYFTQKYHFHDSMGSRTTPWKYFMLWWQHSQFKLFGTGVGSFEWLGPMIQDESVGSSYFLQLHNDWLQVLFEMGWVGFILVLLFYVKLFNKAQSRMLPVIAGLGAFALTYHPLRFFISSLFIVCVIREVLKKPKGGFRC